MNRIRLNMISSVIYKLVVIVTGLLVQRYVLSTFGSDINGLFSTITQFLTYLALLESGIGTASIQALYHPLANDDWTRANGILNATQNQYRKIGIVFTTLLVGLAFLIPNVISGQVDAVTAGLLTFISGFSSVITYLILGRYTVLLNADKRIGVIYSVDSLINILSCVLRIGAIKMGCGIVAVQFVLVLTAVLRALLLIGYVCRHYPKRDASVPPDIRAIGKRWSVMVHQIAGLVVNHTDVLILTFASTLKSVSVYSVYNYVYSNISSFLSTAFQNALQANFGFLTSKGQKEYNKFFKLYEGIFMAVMFAVLTTTLLMTLPFVMLYTKNVTDTQYYSLFLPILFFTIQLMNLLRTPAVMTINAFGWFKETRNGAIIEAVINIVVSIILFSFIGMPGLLIGTICSFLYRTQDVIVFVYKRCGLKLRDLLLRIGANLVVLVGWIYALYWKEPITASTWIVWVIRAAFVFIGTTISYAIVNYLLSPKRYNEFLRKFLLRK